MDNHGECIVVLSGDGNQRNCTSVSIMDAILAAMKHRIKVVVWCWRQCGSENYTRLQQQYPDCFSLNFLDDCCRRPSPPTPTLIMPTLQPPQPKAKASPSKLFVKAPTSLAAASAACGATVKSQAPTVSAASFAERLGAFRSGDKPVSGAAVGGGGCGGGQQMARAVQAPHSCSVPPPSASQESDSASAAPRPIAPKVSVTITLQSSGDIIGACSAEHVKECIQRELKGAKVALDGLVSTGKSFGQTKKDFIFVNFVSVRSAEAALQHYRDAPLLTLQGKQYPVTAAWDPKCKALIDKAVAEAKAAAKTKAATEAKAAAEAKAASEAKAAAAAKAAAEAVNAMLGLHEVSKADSGTTSDADSEWDALFDFDARSETSQMTETSLLDLLWPASPLDLGGGDAAAAFLSSQPARSESGSPIQDVGAMQLLSRTAGALAHVEDSDSGSGAAQALKVKTLPDDRQTFGGAEGSRSQVTAASLLEFLWPTPLLDVADGDAAILLPRQIDCLESGSPIQDDGIMQVVDHTAGALTHVDVEETGSSSGSAKTSDGAANVFQVEPEHEALLLPTTP